MADRLQIFGGGLGRPLMESVYPGLNIDTLRGLGLLPGRKPFNCGTDRTEFVPAMVQGYRNQAPISPDGQMLGVFQVRRGSIYQFTPAYFNREDSACTDYLIKRSDRDSIATIVSGRQIGNHIVEGSLSSPERIVSWYIPHEISKRAFEETTLRHGWANAFLLKRPLYYARLQRSMSLEECNRLEILYSQADRQISYEYDPSLRPYVGSLIGYLGGENRSVMIGTDTGSSVDVTLQSPDKTYVDYFPDGSRIVSTMDRESARTLRHTFTVGLESLAAALENLATGYAYSALELREAGAGMAEITADFQLPVISSTYIPPSGRDYAHQLRVERFIMPWKRITEDMESSYKWLNSGFETEYIPQPVVNGNITDIGQGQPPENATSGSRQMNRWGLGGEDVGNSQVVEDVGHPTKLLSGYFSDQIQALLWYQHGITDAFLTVLPAVFWAGAFMQSGIISLITGTLYPLAFGLYMGNALKSYGNSGRLMGMTFGDLLDKEATIKNLGPTYADATMSAYKILLRCGIDPGFIVTPSGSAGDRETNDRVMIVPNAVRLAFNIAAFSLGSVFILSSMMYSPEITSTLEKICYLFNTVFPLLDGALRVRGINRDFASFPAFNPRTTEHSFAPGTHNVRLIIQDITGNRFVDNQTVTRTGDDVVVVRQVRQQDGTTRPETVRLDGNGDTAVPIESRNIDILGLSIGQLRFFWDYGDGQEVETEMPAMIPGWKNFVEDLGIYARQDLNNLKNRILRRPRTP